MNYGMPYKGSKNRIANWIIDNLPRAEYFVDLFGGGGAVTHAALLSGKYKKFIFNDIDSVAVNGFKMAVNGEFKNENRWISREDFEALKDSDSYVATCFSFGNNCRDYAYCREIEPWKKALHYARVFKDFSEFEKFGVYSDGNCADIKAHKYEYKALYIKWYLKNVLKSEKEYKLEKEELEKNIKEESDKLRQYLIDARNAEGLKSSDIDKFLGTNGMAGRYFGRSQWEFPTREAYNKLQEIMPSLEDYEEVAGLSLLYQSLQSLESLQRLQRLESLQSLQSLQSLESLQRLQSLQSLQSTIDFYNTSYENVPLPENSVIYCDIPYRETDSYKHDFDYNKFYKWAKENKVYISEYNMPPEFETIAEKNKRCAFGTGNRKQTIERIFK